MEYLRIIKDEGGADSFRLIKFIADKETCLRQNSLRKVGSHMSKAVPVVAIHSFFKNAEEPTEDFYDEVIEVPVIEHEKLSEKELKELSAVCDTNTIK